VLADEAFDEVERSDEAAAEARLPRLIPAVNVMNVVAREFAEDDGKTHFFLRDARTVDQGRSALGFPLRSARRRSRVRRCDAVTGTLSESATTLSQMA
jgi:hypothetical protein